MQFARCAVCTQSRPGALSLPQKGHGLNAYGYVAFTVWYMLIRETSLHSCTPFLFPALERPWPECLWVCGIVCLVHVDQRDIYEQLAHPFSLPQKGNCLAGLGYVALPAWNTLIRETSMNSQHTLSPCLRKAMA